MKKIKGLDSIRFVCAMVVLIGHFGVPLPAWLSGPEAQGYLRYAGILINLIFNGPAAVIVFFVISGFCIHYPFRESKSVNLLPYYSRRLLRIGIPAIIAVMLYKIFDLDLKPPSFGVFWSIICEVVYYLLYPALFYIRKSVKWEYIFLTAYLVSFVVLLNNFDALRAQNNGYPALGLFTWLIGLPCWILGCWLSENYLRFKVLTFNQIWIFRMFIVSVFLALSIIKFHAPTVFASNCFTLNLFALIACAWLGFEIMYYKDKEPFGAFEWAGKWSYSLYIMHPATYGLIAYLGYGGFIDAHKSVLLISSLLVSYLFYLVLENPSHKFSAYVSSGLSKKKKTTEIGNVVVNP